ncbi:beta-lactamase/transpeptidase-like protein [Fusarium redolens]|uniref:Beta-lactamase/transpeptidase-like protein n=1 Tax=Fusarium redolens TaxID=48865 RepID=A0A9P9JWC2_FUSRE|nr:beta-lactamase/transpeptidase-like protein [Fusarium redolens]KAH7234975.1 beta-lactamase/transpeptidase-like protein [Fusarium redolens]
MGGAEINDPFTPEFAEFVAETMDEWKLLGTSIAVVDGDEVFSQAFGYATLPDIPATPETLWYGGSTTKAFVTTALAYLIESKEYSALSDGWQTRVSSIIREDFVTQDDWATNNITLEDLASHRAGLSNNDAGIRLHEDGRQWTIRDIARNIRSSPLESQPRTSFSYNNEAYATLSLVIETVTGKWLGDVLKQTIWGPLGMNSTYLDLQEAEDAPEHLSTGYYWDQAEKCHRSIKQLPTDILSGAGAIISNVVDYTKWIKCLLRQDAPLSKQVHKDIRRPRIVDNPDPARGTDVSLYGLSWWRTSIDGHVVYWHSGSTTAHGALIYWLPEVDYGVVVLANHPSPVREIIVRRLVNDKLKVTLDKRYDVAKDAREAERQRQQDAENAVSTLFPNAPSTPRQPSVDVEELAGKYYHPGYGVFDFTTAQRADSSGPKDLVADRTDVLWRSRVLLRHVSGDFWVMFSSLMDTPGVPEMFFATEFKLGVDLEVLGLTLRFTKKYSSYEVFLSKV